MAEPLTLDRLEKLLEELEPAAIRAQYGEALKAQPQCLAMLAHFESMDEDLEALKAATPPAPRPVPLQPEATVTPMRPVQTARPHPLWRLTTWALPLAAAIVFALLLFTRSPQVMQAERSAALELPESLPVAPDAAPEPSARNEADGAQQREQYENLQADKPLDKDAGPVIETKLESESAVPAEKAKTDAPRFSAPEPKQTLAKDNSFAKSSKIEPPAPQKAEAPDLKAGNAAAALRDKLSEQSEELAAVPVESRSAQAPAPRGRSSLDEAKKDARPAADDFAAGQASQPQRQDTLERAASTNSSMIDLWLNRYEKRLYGLSPSDASLFAKAADIRRPAAASGWPKFKLLSVESANSAWLEAFDVSGNSLGRVHLLLDGEGLCIALVAE